MFKRSGNSAFRRLALLFFIIEVAVLVGVSFLLFRYARVQEQADLKARNEMAAQSIEQIDEQIKSVYNLLTNLSTDSRLSQIAYHMYPNEYERSRVVLGIIGTIRNMCSVNASIEDVKITFPSEGLELSNIKGYSKRGTYSYPNEGEINLSDYLFYEGEKLKARIAYPLGARMFGNEASYECEVVFTKSFPYAFLTMFGENEGSGAMFVVTDMDGKVHSLTPQEDSPITAYVMDKIAADGGEVSLREETVLGNDRFSISYETAQRYPITLVTWRNINSLSGNMMITLISIFAVILISGMLFLIFIIQANRNVAKPIYQLMDAFKNVKEGDLSTRIRHEKNDEFYFIYDSFNSMTGRIEQLIENIKEQHNLLQNAELMQLQAQINPHFLYNSFLVIKYMATGEEYEQITEFVSMLAEYYRFINKETRQAIPLWAEVKHMETYVYIQQLRFESRIQVEQGTLPDEAKDLLVPKLILQPLVENCYNHGLKNKLENGRIFIAFKLEKNMLTIEIADNGEEMDEVKLEELRRRIGETDDGSISHALANTRRRLELAYATSDMLTLSIGEEGGLKVTLTIDITRFPSNSL